VPGTTARFAVRPPLPYTLRFEVHVDQVVAGERVAATVGGDVCGEARLEVAPAGSGSTARLAWTLELERPALRRLGRVARPAMVWGHDWIVARGVRQFTERALGA
jgi:hypothetical protein